MERIAQRRATSREIWKVDAGEIKSISCRCATPSALHRETHRLPPYDSLPLVSRITVDEFVANIAVLVPKIKLHIPDEVKTYTRLVQLASELVSEMVYVSKPVGTPPETLREYTQEQFTA